MQVCTSCGHENRPGVLFCENCGTSLTGQPGAGSTKGLDDDIQPSVSEQVISAGTDFLAPGAALRIEIEGGPEPIVIRPRQELIFGRRDPATGAMPDIDLTPYAGYRMGVSRRHAAIRSAEEHHLDVWDLGSSNGTYLNGVRLNPHRPYRLHDGDRIRLGQMVIRILFTAPQPAEDGAPSIGLQAAITSASAAAPPSGEPASGEPAPITRNAEDLEAAIEQVLGEQAEPAPVEAPAVEEPAAAEPAASDEAVTDAAEAESPAAEAPAAEAAADKPATEAVEPAEAVASDEAAASDEAVASEEHAAPSAAADAPPRAGTSETEPDHDNKPA
ncbi:MAG: FHA domain-containing protein [Anaerolineae bacterium]|nr:FHA domain-containing protein [Anaerolineae bacterium]